MDPLPLIPEKYSNHEVAPTLRSALQDTIDGNVYPKAIAERFARDKDREREEDNNNKHLAKNVLEIYEQGQQSTAKTQLAAADVMLQNALYLIDKNQIDGASELREKIKLERCTLFKKLEAEFVIEFNLLQSSDLMPDLIYQYLDFRNHDHTVCNVCKEKVNKTKDVKQKQNLELKRSLGSKTTIIENRKSFQIKPKHVLFHNYEVDKVYKKTIKIINSSPITQSIAIAKFPKGDYFSVIINNNLRLAPGMSITATVTFKPKIYLNLEDRVIFKNKEGETMETVMSCSRDLPKLITCIFKSNSNLLDRCDPGSNKFLEKRREALNSTIDCGSCLVSQYVLVSIILENKGINGKFFFMTEDEWFYQDIETISSCLELFKGDFWVYPTYFEIQSGEVVEINIIFQPTKPGLHVETLYLICDNNAYEQIEIMGDALEFTKNFIEIEVPPTVDHITQRQDYCIYMGHILDNTSHTIQIIARNKSYLLLTCEWRFTHKLSEGVQKIQDHWITQKSYHTKLAPYGSIEYEFRIFFDAEKPGYHSIFLNFYITNIPMIALEENDDFICVEREGIQDKTLSKPVDVLIKEIEICAMIENPKPPEIHCYCDTTCETDYVQKMGFSCPFIKLGILPSGISVQKELYIRNDSNEDLNWKILEVKYNIDLKPYMDVIQNSPHLSHVSGFCEKHRNQKLMYKTVYKKPLSWVSILVLISVNSAMKSEIEDICIISYEIVNFNMVVRAKNVKQSTYPVIMPLHLMFRGIPTEIKFGIENRSHITGFFQFFSPFGEDRDKLVVQFTPSLSVIKPLEIVTITAKVICCEIGTIQNFFVPCFIGLGQEPLILRILCTVDGPHVVFHLPVEKKQYKEVIWPPKIVYEYDADPWCSCKYQECMEGENGDNVNFPPYPYQPFDHLLNKHSDDTYTVNEEDTNRSNTQTKNLTSSEEESSSNSSLNRVKNLVEILYEEFESEMVLPEDVVEIYDIPILTPTKITLYLQNITPIQTKYNFEPQHFVDNNKFDHVAVRLHLKKKEELWNELMGTEHGVLVQPEFASGDLNPFESVKIDIWIYANTYGIYQEDILVDLMEIPTYTFTLLLQVVGCPLMLPMALNCVTECPTIRFGTIAFNTPHKSREVKLINTSCIPVHILWHPFLKKPNNTDFNPDDAFNVFFEMADEENSDKVVRLVCSMDPYVGKNTGEFCDIDPRETFIEKHSTAFIRIILKPEYFGTPSETIDCEACLIGHLFLKRKHKKKANYYLRKTGPDINSIKIAATVTLERPRLRLEISEIGLIKIRMYANEVLLKKQFIYYKPTVLRNCGSSTLYVEIDIEEPFHFQTENGLKSHLTSRIGPYGCFELNFACYITYEQILTLSDLVYENVCLTDKYPFCEKFGDMEEACNIDFLEKIVQINKRVTVIHPESEETTHFPLQAFIYYPRISVTPSLVKFGPLLLFTTFKSMLTIYNYTGYEVKFEIYKSSGAKCFLVIPHYGEVPPAAVGHTSFVNIFIYFCPNECRKYKESIRIVTNIPNYFVEIPLKGSGSINAKFAINYKI